MFCGSVDEKLYNSVMEQKRQLVRMNHEIKQGDIYLAGLRCDRYVSLLHGNIFANLSKFINTKLDYYKFNKKKAPFSPRKIRQYPANYFSEYKIAVYTCVFGNYDQIVEPLCYPDNIDYYVITDNKSFDSEKWKSVDAEKFSEYTQNLSNVEKNRWFKMHPERVFGHEYRYSIYIDGNILPVTDFTEFVNRLGDVGIAMFAHRYNDCVYQEALNNYYLIKKVPSEEITKQVEYLRAANMPEHYGMTTCNVIVRDHENPIVLKLMNDWWKEFMTNCRRDQLSFPYVAWKNGVDMSDIATLGNDVWTSESLFVLEHK